MINPELKIGDRIYLIIMEGETSVYFGDKGTVTGVAKLFGDTQYQVDWDNGSKLDLISGVDKWDYEENFKKKIKQKLQEMTSSSSGGRVKVPVVLAPQLWKNEQLGAFTIPASKYLSGDISYDSYDNRMERTPKQIKREENLAKRKANLATKMFGQSDQDGNPINGYNPIGNQEPGTPKYIEKIAKLPKSEKKLSIKNYPKEKKLLSKSKMLEQVDERGIYENIDILKFFNWKFLKEYLLVLRDSGIINMFGASPFLYMGRNRIENEFKYRHIPDEEKFEELLSMADQAQSEMIIGTMKYLESINKEPDLNNINRYIGKMSNKMWTIWTSLPM